MSIRHLAWETVSSIAYGLDPEEIYNLSLSCRHLHGILSDNNICRRVLQSVAPSATETTSASSTREYAKALRQLVKRRQAISTARPFLAAVVGEAESFLYANGVLCHLRGGLLRTLDIHGSATREHVIDIPKLLEASKVPQQVTGNRYKVRILHYAADFVSCRLLPKDSSVSWLLVIQPSQGTVIARELASSHKLFVRNDAEYLYYGTYCDSSDQGSRRWSLRGCRLRDAEWQSYPLQLTDMVGSDIGSNVCFEIIDGYFYGLANQASFEREEIRWTSYYTCVRFPVSTGCPKNPQLGTDKEIWRKFHSEGPIDDRWTFLNLVKDDATGRLTIVEGRREWRAGASASRTYYTTELKFDCQSDATTSNAPDGSLSPDPSPPASQDSMCASAAAADQQEPPTSRSPHTLHPGDNYASPSQFTLRNTLVRSYHLGSQAFMDLVSDPLPDDPKQKPRIRLRVGSRRLRPRGGGVGKDDELADVYGQSSAMPDNPLYPQQQIDALYENSEVQLWPPPEWDDGSQGMEELHEILSPKRPHQGTFSGMWDERSLCYAAGKHRKTIVLISFDPAIRLRGTRPWPSRADNESAAPAAHVSPSDEVLPGKAAWVWEERPMYESIGKGFHFS